MNILMIILSLIQLINITKCSKPFKITIGLIYCDEIELTRAEETLIELNEEKNQNSKTKIRIEIKPLKLKEDDNPVSVSLSICENLMSNSFIYGVVIANSDCLTKKKNDKTDYLLTLSAVSFTCSYYQIPVLDLSNRNSIFSDKSIHNSFIRMTPPYYHQASIWIELLKTFEWKTVNLVYSSDEEGKSLASRFQHLADQNEIKISLQLEFFSSSDNYTYVAKALQQSHSKVFLLQADSKDIENILKSADEYDLLTSGNVWITCDEILKNNQLATSRNGLLFAEYDEKLDLIYSAFAIIKKTYEFYNLSLLENRPASNCSDYGLSWRTGVKFYEDIASNSFEFNQQTIEFDEERERFSSTYNIINIKGNNLFKIGEFKKDLKGTELSINESKIIWPGNVNRRPDGTKWSSKLRIVVIEEKPFVFKFKKTKNIVSCKQIDNSSIECPWSNKNGQDNFQEYCCYGYCIDLIKTLSEKLFFEYEIYLVPDGLYGDLVVDSNGRKDWNGLMKEILDDKADLILAPFTITPERATYVDFTKPFKYQGITILVKRSKRDSNLVSFLQPFKEDLWIMILISIHVVAIVLYLLDRFSPFAHFKLSKDTHSEEDALNLSRAVWFTWGVLFNSGIGEGTPRSFSARVLGMVWAGFAMIMVSSYTANLAAFLVLDRPEASISGINDARLRNNQENYTYATVKGSSVDRYFKRQIELSSMYRTMESRNFLTAEGAIEALRKEDIKAFIWDSVRLEYESRLSCEFICTGELFGRSSYALALKKGNPWLNKLSQQILILHENGIMEEFDKKWILLNNTNCQTKDSPSTLGLTNMAGVFMLVAGGIILGIFLIFIEIAYKNRKDKKIRQHEVSRKAFATWRKNIEKRKMRSARDSIDALAHELNKIIEKPVSNHEHQNTLKVPSEVQTINENRFKIHSVIDKTLKKSSLNLSKKIFT